jgi:hypothetical protein
LGIPGGNTVFKVVPSLLTPALKEVPVKPTNETSAGGIKSVPVITIGV